MPGVSRLVVEYTKNVRAFYLRDGGLIPKADAPLATCGGGGGGDTTLDGGSGGGARVAGVRLCGGSGKRVSLDIRLVSSGEVLPRPTVGCSAC